MVRLDDMRLFAALAEHGSLSASARSLGISKQTLSRRLLELEEALGVELARRTTRAVTLTDVGRAYAVRCADVTRLADEANRAAASQLTVLSGTLRITADSSFGEAFLPTLMAAYLGAYPDVDVDVVLTSRKVDLLEEGFDVAFRVGRPPDVHHLAATRLGAARLWTVATPDYLERRGSPRHLDELSAHDCIALVPNERTTAWPFAIDGQLRMLSVSSRLRVNGLALARNAALRGLGIAHVPAFAVADDVACNRLRRVLQEFAPEVGGVHVVYPHSRLLAPKVTEFVAMAVEHFSGAFGDPTQSPIARLASRLLPT